MHLTPTPPHGAAEGSHTQYSEVCQPFNMSDIPLVDGLKLPSRSSYQCGSRIISMMLDHLVRPIRDHNDPRWVYNNHKLLKYIYISIYLSRYIPLYPHISPYIPIYPVISHCTPIYPHISPWYNIFLVDHQTVSPKWHGPCLGYPNQVSTASPKSPSMEPVTHKKWVESWKMWPKHKTLSAIMGEQWDICINVCVFIVLFKWKMWILPKQTWLNRQTNWIWRSNWWYFMIWWYCQHFGWVTYHPIR